MENFKWIVHRNQKIIGTISAPSEWEALRLAKNEFGPCVFLIRTAAC